MQPINQDPPKGVKVTQKDKLWYCLCGSYHPSARGADVASGEQMF